MFEVDNCVSYSGYSTVKKNLLNNDPDLSIISKRTRYFINECIINWPSNTQYRVVLAETCKRRFVSEREYGIKKVHETGMVFFRIFHCTNFALRNVIFNSRFPLFLRDKSIYFKIRKIENQKVVRIIILVKLVHSIMALIYKENSVIVE